MYNAEFQRGLGGNYLPLMLRSTCLVLWALIGVTTPLYFLPSGLPQIADFMTAGLVALLIIQCGIRLKPSEAQSAGLLIGFVAYTVLVNLIWALILGDPALLVHSGYYLFNGLVYLAVLILHHLFGKHFLKVTLWSTLACVLLQVALTLILFDSASLRQSGTFNNPNQLGYFALLSGTLLFIATHYLPIKRIYVVTAFTGVLLLTVFSLSKAAIIGAVFLIFILAVKRPVILILVATALSALFFTSDISSVTVERLTERLGSFGQSDDSLAGRGYDRIVNHQEYLVFGAGEGAYDRFTSLNQGNELHSSFGTVLFSYGILGSLIFAAFLYTVFARARSIVLVSFLPLLLYSTTHQGLRFTTLWILLAVTVCFVNYPTHSRTESS